MSYSKKTSIALLLIFACLDVTYFYGVLISLTEEGSGHLFWVSFAGIGFAYLFGYKTEVILSKKKPGKKAI